MGQKALGTWGAQSSGITSPFEYKGESAATTNNKMRRKRAKERRGKHTREKDRVKDKGTGKWTRRKVVATDEATFAGATLRTTLAC